MGYTHYWNQRRDFTREQWSQVSADVGAILKLVQHVNGIPLANGAGDPRTSPEFGPNEILFNGLGDDAHETFILYRVRPPKEAWQSVRGNDFCKTARKPYDLAVTACLCYLATVTRDDDPASHEPIIGSETHCVSSDGKGGDFLAGLEAARAALPRYANQLDLPMQIMQDDLWCAPWISGKTKRFEVRFCVDGKGYVLHGSESYCFESHLALAQFLERNKAADFRSGGQVVVGGRSYGGYGRSEPDIWNATGSFDEKRHARLGRIQERVLSKLFPADPSCAQSPPAYVRPGEMPENGGREFCYYLSDLLKLAEPA